MHIRGTSIHAREHGPQPWDQEPALALKEVSRRVRLRKVSSPEWKEPGGSERVDQCLGKRDGKKGWEEEEQG